MAVLLGFALSGCTVEKDDPLSIGRFEVVATRTESCGDDVYLASPATETFWVFLRKTSATVVLWDDGRDRWPLTLAEDGSFAGAAEMWVAMDTTYPTGEPSEEPPDPWEEEGEPPEEASCVMQRIDRVSGKLLEEAFEGTLEHAFAAATDSDCSPLMAPPLPLADSLPCRVAFDLEATRIR